MSHKRTPVIQVIHSAVTDILFKIIRYRYLLEALRKGTYDLCFDAEFNCHQITTLIKLPKKSPIYQETSLQENLRENICTLRHITIKPFFEVCDQHKPDRIGIEGKELEILD